MKTPRDILLARHQSTAPQLDAIRRRVVTGLTHQDTRANSNAIGRMHGWLTVGHKLWGELILPSRRVWSGLAAAWALIILVNFSLRDAAPATGHKPSVPPAPMTWQQQQLLAELANPETWRMADRVRTYSPRPRSESARMAAT